MIASAKSQTHSPVLRRMGRGDLTADGFLSTFRDWAGDCTDFPRDMAAMALALSEGGGRLPAWRVASPSR